MSELKNDANVATKPATAVEIFKSSLVIMPLNEDKITEAWGALSPKLDAALNAERTKLTADAAKEADKDKRTALRRKLIALGEVEGMLLELNDVHEAKETPIATEEFILSFTNAAAHAEAAKNLAASMSKTVAEVLPLMPKQLFEAEKNVELKNEYSAYVKALKAFAKAKAANESLEGIIKTTDALLNNTEFNTALEAGASKFTTTDTEKEQFISWAINTIHTAKLTASAKTQKVDADGNVSEKAKKSKMKLVSSHAMFATVTGLEFKSTELVEKLHAAGLSVIADGRLCDVDAKKNLYHCGTGADKKARTNEKGKAMAGMGNEAKLVIMLKHVQTIDPKATIELVREA